jgi:SAM-dependent methyltransferase
VRAFKNTFFTMWRCIGCGSIHCAEDADLPRYYAGYPLSNQPNNVLSRLACHNQLRMLERASFRRSMTLLDFGCGGGLFVEYLQDAGVSSCGYDPYVARYNDPIVLDNTYDAVVSFDVIEHDDDPRRFFDDLVQHVNPGGILTIGTPRAEGVSLHRPKDPSLHPPYHRHILSERIMVELGRQRGLELVRVDRRSFADTLVPFANYQSMQAYIEATGGFLDIVAEPPRLRTVMGSPRFLFLGLFGYLLPRRNYMIVTFRKPASG